MSIEMSIESTGESISLYCDSCGTEVPGFNHFHDAVDYKKQHDWKSTKFNNDEWWDVCPDCQEVE